MSPTGHDRHDSHDRHADHDGDFTAVHFTSPPPATSVNRLAVSATVHCLTGCAIGEVAGMVIGTALQWSNGATIALSIVLAFISGYALTMLPLLSVGIAFGAATRLALAADTVSIAIMEVVDNAIMLVIPARWTRTCRLHFSGEASPSRSSSRGWPRSRRT